MNIKPELQRGSGRSAVAPTTYFVTQEHYDRLVDNVINGAQPPEHMSCDWLGTLYNPILYPLKVYRKLQELKHANQNSSQHAD